MRPIDADALYESTAAWEESALTRIEELNKTPLDEMDDAQRALWIKWTAILNERTAFKHDVLDAPTIDVEPKRKKGKWIRGDAAPHRIYCSNCYATYIPNDMWLSWTTDGKDYPRLPRNFCPNCGADMRHERRSQCRD